MTYVEYVALLQVTLTPEQDAACRYLERRGKHFGVEFGYENAIEMAKADWTDRKRRRPPSNPPLSLT